MKKKTLFRQPSFLTAFCGVCMCDKSLGFRVFDIHSFFIKTSNFEAEAERSFFLRFELENFLSMFLIKLCGIVFQCIMQ